VPVTAEVQVVLDLLAQNTGPTLAAMSAPAAREFFLSYSLLGWTPDEGAENRTIPGRAGDIPVRIYRPSETPTGAVLWFHGGGFVLGDLDTGERAARAVADAAGAVVISVGYRLAPEDRFPAAADDGYAALEWVAGHAAELGVSPACVAVGGDSAGGNLAAVAALMTRDRRGPELAFQLLVYPCLDTSMASPSYRDNGEGYFLTTQSMRWFWDCYLGPEGDPTSPYVCPILATDLTGVAPALVITAEYDPLRDEGEAYGARLAASGIPVTATRYDSQIHGFFAQPFFGAGGTEAVDESGRALRRAFSS
jgi:acetyl esterase